MRPFAILLMTLSLAPSGCCEILKAEARSLEREFAACEAGDECVVYAYFDDGASEQTGVGNSCVPQFQCSTALNADADLDEFTRRAIEISERFDRLCNVCMMASCASPGGAVCNTDTGRCELTDEWVLDNDARIAVDPEQMDFGWVGTGASLTLELGVSSVGTDTLYLEDLFVDGPSAFALDDHGVERILAPGSGTVLPVTCSPSEAGEHRATVWIGSNDSERPYLSIPAHCQGVVPARASR